MSLVLYSKLIEIEESLNDDHVVVADAHVWDLYRDRLGRVKPILVPPGESSKSFHELERICRALAGQGTRRSQTIVAIGGGVIGDLAGLAAATYMRGLRFRSVPTTLLAMVDSAIGGKVGIDLPEGKNLVGAFYPAERIDISLQFLATLDERHLRNGMAEVIKYGFIVDPTILHLVPGDWESIVPRCIGIKTAVVQEDPTEQSGRRSILNFGHTIGHAIERVLNYSTLLHGEAVAIGMVHEALLGEELGVSPPGTAQIVADVVTRTGLPVTHPVLDDADALVEAMRLDKKASGTGLAFSLLTRIGDCKLVTNIEESAARAALHR